MRPADRRLPGTVIDHLTLDNPTDRALFQLGTWPSELRSAIFITVHAAQKDRLLSAARMATGAFSRKIKTM